MRNDACNSEVAIGTPSLLAQGDIFVMTPVRYHERIAADVERSAVATRAAGIEMQQGHRSRQAQMASALRGAILVSHSC